MSETEELIEQLKAVSTKRDTFQSAILAKSAVGTLNGVNVHPRDVFSIAVRWNAHSIVVAHNHPSGGLEPSKRDLDLTWCLHAAGGMMGIPLVDHIILTDRSHYSFADSGRLRPPNTPVRPEARQQGVGLARGFGGFGGSHLSDTVGRIRRVTPE